MSAPPPKPSPPTSAAPSPAATSTAGSPAAPSGPPPAKSTTSSPDPKAGRPAWTTASCYAPSTTSSPSTDGDGNCSSTPTAQQQPETPPASAHSTATHHQSRQPEREHVMAPHCGPCEQSERGPLA